MNTTQQKLYYAQSPKAFEFPRFRIFLVDYASDHSKTIQWTAKPNFLASIIKGGDFETRQNIVVSDGLEFQRIAASTFPAVGVIIECDDVISEANLDFKQIELALIFKKIFCDLHLSPFFESHSYKEALSTILQPRKKVEKRKWIKKVMQKLHEEWDAFPSLLDLSHELALHPVTISKYFSESTGTTLSGYVRKVKVNRAVDMLLNTKESLASVAFKCGFSDQSHMSRLVKKYMGYTPGTIKALS